jgi:hypothetical protein
MAAPVAAWRQGTHASVDCMGCHSDAGVVGYLQAHVGDGLRDVWVHYTAPPSQITTAVMPPSRCLKCHTASPPKGTPEFPTNPDHPADTAFCPECHGSQIHPGTAQSKPPQ